MRVFLHRAADQRRSDGENSTKGRISPLAKSRGPITSELGPLNPLYVTREFWDWNPIYSFIPFGRSWETATFTLFCVFRRVC